MSDKIETLFFIELVKAIRLKVYWKIIYSHDAWLDYQEQKAAFIRRNWTDTNYDFKTSDDIPGMLENIGVYNGKEEPLFLNKYLMIFLDLIMFGWL